MDPEQRSLSALSTDRVEPRVGYSTWSMKRWRLLELKELRPTPFTLLGLSDGFLFPMATQYN